MKKIVLLKKSELNKLLKKAPLWTPNSKYTQISKTLSFKNHIDALVSVARITIHAQVLNHHPELILTYKKVKITLTTHECKGLTTKDFELAKRIDSLKDRG